MTGVSRGQGWTPLMYAAAAGDLAAVNLLIEHTADVNARVPETGVTALMLAASTGHAETVTALLDRHGAELRAVDVEKRDASDHAARGGHGDLAMALDMRAVSPYAHRDVAWRPIKITRPGGSLAKPPDEGTEP